jgi:hypothetical protein
MSEFVFRTNEAVASLRTAISFKFVCATSSYSGPAERVVPLSIPRDQAYYWGSQWQADLRASHRALAAGDYEEFGSDDPNDVVRWFLSDDD